MKENEEKIVVKCIKLSLKSRILGVVRTKTGYICVKSDSIILFY